MKQIALAGIWHSPHWRHLHSTGPYVESKHEFKGTDEDYSKAVHQGRVGYETKVGALTPYIEGWSGCFLPRWWW